MELPDSGQADDPSLSDEELAAFLETSQADVQERDVRGEAAGRVNERFTAMLSSVAYAPLVVGMERHTTELSAEIEKLFHEVAEMQRLEYEWISSLPENHELKRAIRDWAHSRLEERAYQEEGLMNFIKDELTKLEFAMHTVFPGTPEYDSLLESYFEYKKRMYAYWIVRQKFDPNHPILVAMNKLFPGVEVDPKSETMVPYLAEAITTLGEKEKRDKRSSEFHNEVYDLLNIDIHNGDLHSERWRATNIIIAHAAYLQSIDDITEAEREEELRRKARDEKLNLSRQDLTVIIQSINKEYPV